MRRRHRSAARVRLMAHIYRRCVGREDKDSRIANFERSAHAARAVRSNQKFLRFPDVIGDPGFHGGRDAEALTNTAEVVPSEMQAVNPRESLKPSSR
jgi:hypothetical protein